MLPQKTINFLCCTEDDDDDDDKVESSEEDEKKDDAQPAAGLGRAKTVMLPAIAIKDSSPMARPLKLRAVTVPHLSPISIVPIQDYSPDVQSKLGGGGYGDVFPVRGNTGQVLKVFNANDWQGVVKEASFAKAASARDPQRYVRCLGVGQVPEGTKYSAQGMNGNFAVLERAPGITLAQAAHRNRRQDGIQTVGEALGVLGELVATMANMRTPSRDGNLHFHLDLKPENIMVQKTPGQGIQVRLIDYGIVTSCSPTDLATVLDSMFQLYRWLGWELLWTLASEQFQLEPKNPWEQLPPGFKPFFAPSSMRPPAYATGGLSAQAIGSSLGDGFFDQVLSADFRKQWKNTAAAKQKLGKLLGQVYLGVAQASDRLPSFAADLQAVCVEIQELRAMATI